MKNDNKLELTLLRHGLSTGNRQGVVQGQLDYPLDPEGIEQAEALAAYWKSDNRTFSRIVSSPLLRARATADIIGQSLAIRIDEDAIWKERRLGDSEGLVYAKIRDKFSISPHYPTVYEPLFSDGEGEWALYLRAADAIQKLLQAHEKSILVISHGAILSAVVCAIMGVSPPSGRTRLPGFRFDNTGFSEFIFDRETARWSMVIHNTRPHLG